MFVVFSCWFIRVCTLVSLLHCHMGLVGRVWQQAAECIAASESRRLGVTVSTKDFKKKGKVARPRAYSMKRFQILLPIFQKALPADLVAAVEHTHTSCVMYRSEPALEHLSLICKYGPFKDCLLTAWQDHESQELPRGLCFVNAGPTQSLTTNAPPQRPPSGLVF